MKKFTSTGAVSLTLMIGWLPCLFLTISKSIDVAEVRFKNSRKDFFKIPADLELSVGDIVAVEASPGHDIGIVSMTGEMVRFPDEKKKINPIPRT